MYFIYMKSAVCLITDKKVRFHTLYKSPKVYFALYLRKDKGFFLHLSPFPFPLSPFLLKCLGKEQFDRLVLLPYLA
jgi:hypothetical protein